MSMQRALLREFRDALKVDAQIVALAGDRIHFDYPDVNSPTPYVVVSLNALTAPNLDARDEYTALVNVQAVADAEQDGDSKATSITDRAVTVLHNAALDLSPDWEMRRCEFDSGYRMSELTDRRRYAIAGAIFRVEADEV